MAAARVHLTGTAEPLRRIKVDGRCEKRSCARRTRTAADGGFDIKLRVWVRPGRSRRTVRISYTGLRDAPSPATVALRFRAPHPPRRVSSVAHGTTPETEQSSRPATSSQGPDAQTYTLPAPQSNSSGTGTMVMIGDSLAEGIAELMPGALPGWSVRVNSRVGRGLAEGMGILSQTRIPEGSVLAISLFTNDDPWRTAQLQTAVQETLARVGVTGCAVWATIAAPPVDGLSYAKANRLLNRLAASESRLRIVPWAEQTASAPQLLGGDGVHPTPAGYRLRAQMYAQAARSCGL